MNVIALYRAWRKINREWAHMETRLETKPGWKTTEFWITVLSTGGSILGAASGILPPQYAAIGLAVSAGLYAISRGLAKQGIDPNQPKP